MSCLRAEENVGYLNNHIALYVIFSWYYQWLEYYHCIGYLTSWETLLFGHYIYYHIIYYNHCVYYLVDQILQNLNNFMRSTKELSWSNKLFIYSTKELFHYKELFIYLTDDLLSFNKLFIYLTIIQAFSGELITFSVFNGLDVFFPAFKIQR